MVAERKVARRVGTTVAAVADMTVELWEVTTVMAMVAVMVVEMEVPVAVWKVALMALVIVDRVVVGVMALG